MLILTINVQETEMPRWLFFYTWYKIVRQKDHNKLISALFE